MRLAYLAFVGVFVIGLLIRDGYEALKSAGRIGTEDRRLFAVVFTSMCAMWVSWFGIGFAAPNRLPVPETVRWIGLGAVVVGSALAVGGMWQLGGVENIDRLVSEGLFSRIRHPMYVGFLLWILGWCAYEGAPASIALGSLAAVSVVWWRHLEERELGRRFGEAYSTYRAGTWF